AVQRERERTALPGRPGQEPRRTFRALLRRRALPAGIRHGDGAAVPVQRLAPGPIADATIGRLLQMQPLHLVALRRFGLGDAPVRRRLRSAVLSRLHGAGSSGFLLGPGCFVLALALHFGESVIEARRSLLLTCFLQYRAVDLAWVLGRV